MEHMWWSLLEINPEKKRVNVLAALLRSVLDKGEPIQYDELIQVLTNIEDGVEQNKSLIYRHLTGLEEDGLIVVDRTKYRHTYWTEFHLMRKSFERRRKELEEIKYSKIRGLKQIRNLLESTEAREIANHLIQRMTGKRQVRSLPRSAQGPESTYWLIDTEVYAKARKGDVIRFTMDWINPQFEQEMQRHLKGEELLEKGVEIRSLLSKESLEDDTVYDRRALVYNEWMSQDWKLHVRIKLDSDRAYQFVSLNDDGIILIVSEHPLTSVWIPKSDNPQLVKDAIMRFDADFERAFNPREAFAERKERP
jgi:hypothetical protein